ncbi:MAG: hypothetical protein OXD30_09440, partial [Bryobacterales bacterium]|nr:hypothetical protein [Bryobacterales bacterium]
MQQWSSLLVGDRPGALMR